MLTRQSMIAIGVAVVLGLLAVMFANALLNKGESAAYKAGTTKVAVATLPLAFGSDITADKVRFVDYPNISIPPGSFSNAAALLPQGQRRVALMPIAVNEPILASKISGAGEGASIAALLPAGMRAAAVRINDVSGVAGFVQPNDSVDVLITRQVGQNNIQVTDILLQNVRVIAIDQQAKNADGTPRLAKTVTLEVDPLNAQKLALAQEVGSLSLILRKPGETDNPVVETVSMEDLRYNVYGGARYPAPAVVGSLGTTVANSLSGATAQISTPRKTYYARPKAKAAVPATSRSVEIYRGTKGDQVEVGNNGR